MNISERRQLALEYLAAATNDDKGRCEGDQVYIAVTEERDTGRSYSSCGDLAHWLLYRLGVRLSCVNRAEHRGWRSGANISWLAFGCVATRNPMVSEQFSPGDILFIWNRPDGTDAHALVVREHNGAELLTAEYGQPGGAQCRRTFLKGKVGNRKLQKVLPLADVVMLAGSRGELVEPQSPEPWLLSTERGPSSHPVLRRGSKSAYVMKLQHLLHLMVDGEFGPNTEAAVRSLQSSAGLPTTGVVDVATWSALLHKAPR